MSDKPRALILSPEIPYPTAGGGTLRTASIMDYFSRHYDVDIITFLEAGSTHPAPAFEAAGFKGGLHVINLPAHSRAFAARAVRNALRAARGVPSLVDRYGGFNAEIERAVADKRYDIGVIEHFWCAPYQDELRPRCNRLWLNLHNVESVLQERSAQAEDWPVSALYRRFAARYRWLEAAWLPSFDRVLTASAEDARVVSERAADARSLIYPNAIPACLRPDVKEDDAIAFSGNFAYGPNISGLRWFLRQVWPLVSRGAPDCKLRLIGRNSEVVQNMLVGLDGVECTGPVDNAIREIARARLAVAPLLSGSGTRVKIIEAWAAARAVVSTTIGAEGLDSQHNRNLVLADEPQTMAQEILRLWNDREDRAALGSEGRATFERQYTWEAAWRVLDQAEGISSSTA